MSLLSAEHVIEVVTKAVAERRILVAQYRRINGPDVVEHRLAPFDIGSTNERTARKYCDTLWAYAFNNVRKNGELQPKICAFDINYFQSMEMTKEQFDEKELAELHAQVANYDYRECSFRLLPKRNWFR